jgi:hypothetical protein
MNARVFASVMACVLTFAVAACAHAGMSYPASTPPAELAPPSPPPSPVPLTARQAIPAIRAEQSRLDRGVYVVCLANDGSLPRGMTSALARARGWPVIRNGGRVQAICPIIGRARILHALRAHDGTTLFDAKVMPIAGAPRLNLANADRVPLQYCAPYAGTKPNANCSLRTTTAGTLRDVGHDFLFPRGSV